ncbi:DUF4158 domain-containing protein [Nonomuraea sp. NPDC049158]|uniref:DUF4158 domain-containing protein n=1 Tax=Nonomuraea sp. NPDC049158 TaxID=3155649 RepID=UPI003409DFBA
MPVEFLSDGEAAAYGRFSGAPSQAELERFFYLDDADRTLIAERRGAHARLGFALQLTTARYVGRFLTGPLDVPDEVLTYLGEQLGIEDVSQINQYTERRNTPFEHQEVIRKAYELKEFSQAEVDFIVWAGARAWNTGDGKKTIFYDGVTWLRTNKVLLPSVTTLARLVARVRDEATDRLHDALRGVLSPRQRVILEMLLEVSEGRRASDLERWRKGPAAPSGRESGEGAGARRGSEWGWGPCRCRRRCRTGGWSTWRGTACRPRRPRCAATDTPASSPRCWPR